MKRFYYLLVFLFVLISTKLYSSNTDSSKICYDRAFNRILLMLENKVQPDFKKAVFIGENAFYNDSMDYDSFNRQIQFLSILAKEIISLDSLTYNDKDKDKIKIYGAVFNVLADTTYKILDSLMIINKPFTYDFDDMWGINDWSKMFVTKLLNNGNGNCHSMPFLYKILCHELGAEAYLALAPNHIYIKCQSKRWGWYNTELTSGIFPVDSWLMASGYIHLSAIQNGIYMDTLSIKESISFCLFDLAKGYERKFGVGDGKFILKCCDSALMYFPNFINALLLKAETKRKIIFQVMEQYHAKTPQDIFHVKDIKVMYEEMENTYMKIHQLGYRQMPEEMYIQWIGSLKSNADLYQNKNILKFEH